MYIPTSRFGQIAIEPEDLIQFPCGLIGLEDCRKWLLLADARNDSVGWLQSADRAEIALAVVSPRRFVPDYQVRVSRRQLEPIETGTSGDAQVLAILAAQSNGTMTLNLKAPLVINLDQLTGIQVIVSEDWAVQHPLTSVAAPLRKSA